MGFFSRLFGGGRTEPQQREANVQVILGVKGVSVGGTTSVKITCDSALTVMAYKRALDVLAGSVARLPFRYLKLKSGIYTDFEASPFHYLLSMQPQKRMSAFDWKYQMVWRAFHDGDAYIYPRIVDGEPVELVLLTRGSCVYDDVNDTYAIADLYNGVSGVFKGSDVLHNLTASPTAVQSVDL